MPNMIMLIGIPGTGKSTWTRKFLQNNPDYVVISSDDILERYAQIEGLNYSESFNKYASKANKLMFKRAAEAFENGKNIIWDQTNLNAKTRKKKIDMAPDEYEIDAVVFNVGFDELAQRLKKREEEENKSIPNHVIKNMARSFEVPSKEEGFNTIKVISS